MKTSKNLMKIFREKFKIVDLEPKKTNQFTHFVHNKSFLKNP